MSAIDWFRKLSISQQIEVIRISAIRLGVQIPDSLLDCDNPDSVSLYLFFKNLPTDLQTKLFEMRDQAETPSFQPTSNKVREDKVANMNLRSDSTFRKAQKTEVPATSNRMTPALFCLCFILLLSIGLWVNQVSKEFRSLNSQLSVFGNKLDTIKKPAPTIKEVGNEKWAEVKAIKEEVNRNSSALDTMRDRYAVTWQQIRTNEDTISTLGENLNSEFAEFRKENDLIIRYWCTRFLEELPERADWHPPLPIEIAKILQREAPELTANTQHENLNVSKLTCLLFHTFEQLDSDKEKYTIVETLLRKMFTNQSSKPFESTVRAGNFVVAQLANSMPIEDTCKLVDKVADLLVARGNLANELNDTNLVALYYAESDLNKLCRSLELGQEKSESMLQCGLSENRIDHWKKSYLVFDNLLQEAGVTDEIASHVSDRIDMWKTCCMQWNKIVTVDLPYSLAIGATVRIYVKPGAQGEIICCIEQRENSKT